MAVVLEDLADAAAALALLPPCFLGVEELRC